MHLLEEMVGAVPGASWILVDEDGAVVYAAGELRGSTHLREVHPDDLPRVLDGASTAPADCPPAFVTHVRVQCAGGGARGS